MDDMQISEMHRESDLVRIEVAKAEGKLSPEQQVIAQPVMFPHDLQQSGL